MAIWMMAAMVAAAGTPYGPVSNPLAPALYGEVECVDPDPVRRTCRALTSYSRNADGTYTSKSRYLVIGEPPSIVESVMDFRLVGNAACSSTSPNARDLDRMTIAGKTASPAERAQVAANARKSYEYFTGGEVCVRHSWLNGELISQVSWDGVPRPDGSRQILWLKPGHNYRVAP